MDLVQLQKSQKSIRNPFGVDFIWTWDKQPIKIPGDGKWYPVIGVLRDHLAKHLFNKIKNQYYDEKVRELQEKNQDHESRAFTVSHVVENKIWKLITGEDLHAVDDTDLLSQQEAADLSELHKEVATMETSSVLSGKAISVSQLLDGAAAQIEATHDGSSDSLHTSGAATVIGEAQPARTVTETPIHVDQVGLPQQPATETVETAAPEAPVQPAAEVAPTPPVTDSFAGISELPNE